MNAVRMTDVAGRQRKANRKTFEGLLHCLHHAANISMWTSPGNFVPAVTAVGGSEFNEGNGNYWAGTLGPNLGSAMGYIPEGAWNDEALAMRGNLGGFAAGGGGVSFYFSKPSWQTGPGVPSDGARDVPDVVLTASALHDPYALISGGNFLPDGGTSASAPSFAGIVTLLNQYLVRTGAQAQPGLGNINPMLYSLAQSTPTAFHDITTGNNIVPCVTNSTPDCTNGSMGYSAGPGYDFVTGLGSVDAYNLALSWKNSPSNTSKTAHLVVTQFTASTKSRHRAHLRCRGPSLTKARWPRAPSRRRCSSPPTELSRLRWVGWSTATRMA
jgi:subtilase family serine protease